mgnify:CR=1 FL=1
MFWYQHIITIQTWIIIPFHKSRKGANGYYLSLDRDIDIIKEIDEKFKSVSIWLAITQVKDPNIEEKLKNNLPSFNIVKKWIEAATKKFNFYSKTSLQLRRNDRRHNKSQRQRWHCRSLRWWIWPHARWRAQQRRRWGELTLYKGCVILDHSLGHSQFCVENHPTFLQR